MLGAHVLSAMIGAAAGVAITCCCVMARREDDELEAYEFDDTDEEEYRGYLEVKKEFTEATRPAVEWFNENCNPHQKIIIEMGGVELVSGEMANSTPPISIMIF